MCSMGVGVCIRKWCETGTSIYTFYIQVQRDGWGLCSFSCSFVFDLILLRYDLYEMARYKNSMYVCLYVCVYVWGVWGWVCVRETAHTPAFCACQWTIFYCIYCFVLSNTDEKEAPRGLKVTKKDYFSLRLSWTRYREGEMGNVSILARNPI